MEGCVLYIYHIGLKGVMKSPKKIAKTGKALVEILLQCKLFVVRNPTRKHLGSINNPGTKSFTLPKKGLWKGKDFCSHELLEVPNEAVKS